MNMQKFTQKALEALKNAQNLAIENQNAQIEEEHLLLALLELDNSLIKELVKKINPNEKLSEELLKKIERKPKITGGARPKDRFLCVSKCRFNTCKRRKTSKRDER